MRVRRLVFNIHLYVALVAAAFVTVLGLTGSIMAFEPELFRLTHRSLTFVTPADHALPLADVQAAAERAFPGEHALSLTVPRDAGESYQVSLEKRAAYVNQYTGAVLGDRPAGMDWLGWVHQAHLRLAVMNRAFPGKEIVTWGAAGMLVLLLSGLYLWWPLKRVRIRWDGAARRSWFDVHNAIGICAYAFLLVLTLTGLSIGLEGTTTSLYYSLTGSEPSKPPRADIVAPDGATRLPIDSVARIAAAAIPGAAPFLIVYPRAKGPYEVRSRFPEDRTPGGRSRVLVHPYSGTVLFAEGSRTAPAGARIVVTNRAIHTGDLYGLPTKLLMSFASLMAVAQVLSGLAMWRLRIRRREPAPS